MKVSTLIYLYFVFTHSFASTVLPMYHILQENRKIQSFVRIPRDPYVFLQVFTHIMLVISHKMHSEGLDSILGCNVVMTTT